MTGRRGDVTGTCAICAICVSTVQLQEIFWAKTPKETWIAAFFLIKSRNTHSIMSNLIRGSCNCGRHVYTIPKPTEMNLCRQCSCALINAHRQLISAIRLYRLPQMGWCHVSIHSGTLSTQNHTEQWLKPGIPRIFSSRQAISPQAARHRVHIPKRPTAGHLWNVHGVMNAAAGYGSSLMRCQT